MTAALLADEAKLEQLFASLSPHRPYAAASPAVDTIFFPATDGAVAVLGVGTRSPTPLRASIRLERPTRLRDLMSDETLGGEAEVEVALEPYGTRLFALEERVA